jgi:leucyl-tRNA synthetase
MELVNAIYAHPAYKSAAPNEAVRAAVEAAVRVLHPMAPHLTEEAWSLLGHDSLLARTPWPDFDPALVQLKRVIYAVQVLGKLRGQVEADADAEQAVVEALARENSAVRAHLDGKETVKVVFVRGRLINFVVR